MAVSAVSQTAATQAASTSSATSVSGQLAATENRFLSLLVAQLKNQDPLNPLDNAQVTSQMAQLSTVQGVNQMNAQLTQLLSEFQGLQAMTLAGRSVLVPGSKLALAATGTNGALQAKGGLELAGDASNVKVQVKNAAGTVVRTIDLGSRPAGVSSFTWDGLGDDGKPLAAGNYSFAVTASASGKAVESRSLAAVKVEGVNRNANGIQLDLGSLGTVSFTDVMQVL